MSDTVKNKNKDKLIAQNSDLSISEFDKELSYDALRGIISAKRNYNKSQEQGDTLGMAKANAYANSIRRQSGSYTGGDDGSGYYFTQNIKNKERPVYKSSYADEIDEIYDEIADRDKFTYDIDSDPLFTLYKRIYEQAGDMAYRRVLAEKSAKTGGMANTNAISAASQAKAYYNNQLAQKATDMYNDAYNKYTDETENLYKKLGTLRDLESDEYEKYINDSSAFESDRAFEYTKFSDMEKSLEDDIRYQVETAYRKSRDDVADSQWLAEQAYAKERDRIADEQWLSEQEYKKLRDKTADEQWQSEMEYKKQQDAISNSLSASSAAARSAQIKSNDEKWRAQNKLDRFNVIARLVDSIYGEDNEGVEIDEVMDFYNKYWNMWD